ncbi:hypothetical protein B0J14DRAFT_602702 [Halenospora varia]|nr:hypothetical protein B0J14DRAFT_602702 [Halenospora varia]
MIQSCMQGCLSTSSAIVYKNVVTTLRPRKQFCLNTRRYEIKPNNNNKMTTMTTTMAGPAEGSRQRKSATVNSSPDTHQQYDTSIEQMSAGSDNSTLQVDFSWRKFKSLVTEKDDPNKPLYIVDFKALKPELVFRNAADDSIFGTGTLHYVSIHADCEVRGKHTQIKALKRWKTSYEHLSHAYSDSDEPVPMTWTSSCDFKNWDFICLDQNQLPVAKFSANFWAIKKVGYIEFLGDRPLTDAMREEIVITGHTLFYTMTIRTSSLLSFFGAIFARPGHIEQDKKPAISE